MNRNLIIFIIISLLAIGSLVVYTKSNVKPDNGKSAVQNLFNFDSSKSQTSTPAPTMNQPQVTKLLIEDEIEGTGSAVVSGNNAEVNYVGTLLDGTKFDSSYDRNQTFSFQVGAGQVISGWDQGLVGMKVGGKRKLTIPSSMGYGPSGSGPIPPNSPLIFEIELVSIK